MGASMMSDRFVISRQQCGHAQGAGCLGEAAIEGAYRGAVNGAEGEVQRIAGAQAQGMLVREPRRRRNCAPDTESMVRLSAARRWNVASTSARCATARSPVRILIDKADENSVTTQALMADFSTGWSPSHA
jgi:hypothetical protein